MRTFIVRAPKGLQEKALHRNPSIDLAPLCTLCSSWALSCCIYSFIAKALRWESVTPRLSLEGWKNGPGMTGRVSGRRVYQAEETADVVRLWGA